VTTISNQFSVLSRAFVAQTLVPLVNVNSQPDLFIGLTASLLDLLWITNLYYQTQILANETSALEELQTVSLGISTPFLNARINGINEWLTTINFSYLTLFMKADIAKVHQGLSVFSFPDIPPLITGFVGEIPPQTTNLVDVLTAQNAEFSEIAAIIAPQTSISGQAKDALNRQIIVGDAILTWVSNLSHANPNLSFQTLWNQNVSVPTYFAIDSLVNQDYSQNAPQNQVANRAMILYLLAMYAGAAASGLSQPAGNAIQTGVLREHETIQQFAFRTTGSFEKWQNIVEINNLVPPYVSTSFNPVPDTASPGMTLYLPPGPTLVPSSYIQNILGTDFNFGTFQNDMPWTGDLGTLTGFSNLRYALIRRLLTPLNGYIFDSTYGSRLPFEIGNINQGFSKLETTRLSAYAGRSILQDPRVQRITKIQVSGNVQSQSYNVNASLVPVGLSPTDFSATIP
jgi:hypothetical protein